MGNHPSTMHEPEPLETFADNNSKEFMKIKLCYTDNAPKKARNEDTEYIYLSDEKFCVLEANASYACFFDNCVAV